MNSTISQTAMYKHRDGRWRRRPGVWVWSLPQLDNPYGPVQQKHCQYSLAWYQASSGAMGRW